MKLPTWAKSMILKPMVNVAVEAYKQAKQDLDNNEYDPVGFEEAVKKKVKEQF